jgi:hypothetical protein
MCEVENGKGTIEAPSAHHACLAGRGPAINRRSMLRYASAAGGAALLSPFTAGFAWAAGAADALLLNCMDYRLTAKTTDYMAGQGLAGKYDQVILAGASLGAVTHKFPDWGHTFRQHLDVAIELHGIHRVIALDHRDCGAYKVILGKDYAGDRAVETEIHAEMLHRLRREINHLHPKLEVTLLLMALDGGVETIG